MSENEVYKITGKLHKLRMLKRAREHVLRLERELYGEPARPPQESTQIPEFLRPHRPLGVV